MKIALIGNPNVGKSTVFNSLTGLKQHTGNWAGKTVSNASGEVNYNNKQYTIYDLPGTYSLISHSKEEEVARNFICFENYDAAIIVCDAVCLERNLNLVLQTIEINKKVIICVNLLDEAKKKKIKIDLEKLSTVLGVPVVGMSARNEKKITKLLDAVDKIEIKKVIDINYNEDIDEAVDMIVPYLDNIKNLNPKWVALTLLNKDESLFKSLNEYLEYDILDIKIIREKVLLAKQYLNREIKDQVVSLIVKQAEKIASEVVQLNEENYNRKDRKIDRILTNKWTGIPIMIALLMLIFWITINGANYPSSLLFDFFSKLEIHILNFLNFIHLPSWLIGLLISGIYRVLTWVVSVMLPPMAIFFPLFTILEDLGYLPRIAFNLDKAFKKCCACGKQALTMAMGFGCNAVGVTGARIIDSPRERLIAILTNVFVPCNGRFPMIISIITMFFIGFQISLGNSLLSVLILTSVILLGVFLTFLVSYILSKTVLKGVPSSFTLELPPYRRPQIGKVIIRSILDRTLFVLGRAVVVAIPAGIIIYILANINIGGTSILSYMTNFFEPFGKLIGMDGVIVMAFILGFPANEIVIPIIVMSYMATGSITEFESLIQLKELLVNNGWTFVTAICVIIFSLCHFPCSTTCLTIKKETNSVKWTLIAFVLPTIIGIGLCFLVNLIFSFI